MHSDNIKIPRRSFTYPYSYALLVTWSLVIEANADSFISHSPAWEHKIKKDHCLKEGYKVKTMWGQHDVVNIFKPWKITSSCFQKQTLHVFQVTKQQPGREMGKIIRESPSHPTTNSLSVKGLQIIPDPECKMIAHWIWLGVTARRQIMRGLWKSQGFDVQTVSSAVFSSNSRQCLTFAQFLRKCSNNHTLIPRGRLANQQKPREVSSLLQLHRQVFSFFPFGHTTGYIGTWLPTDTSREVSFIKKGTSDPKPLGRRRHLSNFQTPKYLCSNSEQNRNQSAELSVKYILQWLPRHDARAKHFQTLDCSHVPTHVEVFWQPSWRPLWKICFLWW